MKRVVTALALAAFAIYSVFFAPPAVFLAIVVGMAALCYYEYAGIAQANGVSGPLWLGYVAGALTIWSPNYTVLVAMVLFITALGLRELNKVLGFVGTVVLGCFYIFLAWSYAGPLRDRSPWWLLFALSINWVGDIAAFYVGRSIGRHKLAPRISPGKSWEGAIGSVVAALGFGLWYNYQFALGVPALYMVVLSLVANVAGQLGDLCESALKRGAGVKDSSTLLPGHGGFLDRLDSTLFSMPVVYFLLEWWKRST